MFGIVIKQLESVIDPSGNINTGLLETYLQEIPERALRLGVKVILALLIFFIGMKLIKWLRKIMRKALKKGNADIGVIQFLDSLAKVVLIACLIIGIASKFGLETTSLVAVLGTASLSIGLALQGGLENLAGGLSECLNSL